MSLDDLKVEELLEEAHKATKNAYCPYSKIAVGAALLAVDGRIFHGGMQNEAGLIKRTETVSLLPMKIRYRGST